jgi:hypothetical protein
MEREKIEGAQKNINKPAGNQNVPLSSSCLKVRVKSVEEIKQELSE